MSFRASSNLSIIWRRPLRLLNLPPSLGQVHLNSLKKKSQGKDTFPDLFFIAGLTSNAMKVDPFPSTPVFQQLFSAFTRVRFSFGLEFFNPNGV